MQNKEVVLITGSSGFIGGHLAQTLKQHYQVVEMDKDFPSDNSPNNHFEVDITSQEKVHSSLMEIKEKYGSRLHSVVHLIAFYDFKGEEDERYQKITIDGTKFLLQELTQNFQVEQFILSSSMLVYKPVAIGDKITDDSPLAPSWPYPQSKVEAEEVLRTECKNIPSVSLRIAGVYDDWCHSPTISQQIMRIFEGQFSSFPFPGDTQAGQAFLHLDDLKDAIHQLIKVRKELSSYEVLVLGEEEVVSFSHMQKIIGNLVHQRPWPAIEVPKFVAKIGAVVMDRMPIMRETFIKPWMIDHSDEHFAVDISKAKNKLHWLPQKKLANTIPVMIKNLKADPHSFYKINKIKKPFYRDLEMIGKDGERNYYFASVFNIFLGLWLMSNPFTFGALSNGEFLSQFLSGLLVTVFAAFSLIPTIRWLRWVNATIGFWLLFSPLVFYTTSVAAYSNDTLIGGLIIIVSAYTPSLAKGLGAPPGWSYNPSTAGQRVPIMLLAFLGFLLSRYMTSFQLGHIQEVWDPFFGDGSRKVLTSSVSKAFPISDAGLGAVTYLLDLVAASIGGRDRWRSLPWAVILLGVMIIPSGVTSITLIMLQPISVGAWCTLCLITALIMLLMVPPAVDEVLASLQFLKRRKAAGESWWKVFWLGATEGEEENVQTVVVKPEGNLIHLIASTILSAWLMFTPWVFDLRGWAANSTYVVAALIFTFSTISLSEVVRLVRLINLPLGLWLALSGWVFTGMSELAIWHSVVLGLIFIGLNLPRGRQQGAYGSMDKIIHWTLFRK